MTAETCSERHNSKQQEPRLLASCADDESMLNAYRNKKDLYATIASEINHNDYWDNMEHHEDGSDYPEGKKRRSAAKSCLLGILYGMGSASLAERIGSTTAEAQKIIDDFYKGFPKVKKWIDKSKEDCKKYGYVEDLWGRRRRLSNINLPAYEVKSGTNDNFVFYCTNRVKNPKQSRANTYIKLLSEAKRKSQVSEIISKASKDGIYITENTGKIALAERQSVNARIQGGAATITKIAMRRVFDDEILNDLGFRLLITVHDRLLSNNLSW